MNITEHAQEIAQKHDIDICMVEDIRSRGGQRARITVFSELGLKGYSSFEIADEFGVTEPTVARAFHLAGIPGKKELSVDYIQLQASKEARDWLENGTGRKVFARYPATKKFPEECEWAAAAINKAMRKGVCSIEIRRRGKNIEHIAVKP